MVDEKFPVIYIRKVEMTIYDFNFMINKVVSNVWSKRCCYGFLPSTSILWIVILLSNYKCIFALMTQIIFLPR